MPERIRRISGLVRPEERGSGALSVGAAGTAGEGWCQQLQGMRSLLWDDAVAERGELRGTAEPRSRGDPAGVKALHPLHEVRAEPTGRVRGSRSRTGEPLPSRDGGSVRSPSPVRAPDSGVSSAQRAGPPPTRRSPSLPGAAARGAGVAGPRRGQQRRRRAGQGHVAVAVPLVRRALDSVRRLRGRQQQPLDLVGQVRAVPPALPLRWMLAAAVLPDVAGRRLQQGARRAMR